jgi:DNA polymerase-3 subunit delta'
MSLASIIGQDKAITVLKNIINQGQASGAYLFLGPDGVGKRTAALEFSKALNCKDNELDACDECVSCNKIKEFNHPDIFIIQREEGSSFIKIDDIRQIIYQTSLKPYEGRVKVFIIINAEDMNEDAQNAFLKILEEPPHNQIFILTSSYISGLLPTVLSRCKIMNFNLLSQGQIEKFLIEMRKFSANEAGLFSHMAMGSMGSAVAFKEKEVIVQRDAMLNNFFLKRDALLKEELLGEKNYKDIEHSLELLLCWYRDILIAKFTDNKDIILNVDRHNDIVMYKDKFSCAELERKTNAIIKTLGYIRSNVNSKMALFNMAIELAS